MALGTFGELKQGITDWLVRSDLTAAFLADLVKLAEVRIESTELEVRELEKEVSGTLTGGDENLALPADYRYTRTYTLSAGGLTFSPQLTSVNEVLNRFNSNDVGQPMRVAVFGTNLIHRPTPDGDYPYTLKYVPRLDLTGDVAGDAATNALLTKYPDLYLFAALAETSAFIHNDERVPLWTQKFELCLTRALGREERERYRGFPIYPRPR